MQYFLKSEHRVISSRVVNIRPVYRHDKRNTNEMADFDRKLEELINSSERTETNANPSGYAAEPDWLSELAELTAEDDTPTPAEEELAIAFEALSEVLDGTPINTQLASGPEEIAMLEASSRNALEEQGMKISMIEAAITRAFDVSTEQAMKIETLERANGRTLSIEKEQTLKIEEQAMKIAMLEAANKQNLMHETRYLCLVAAVERAQYISANYKQKKTREWYAQKAKQPSSNKQRNYVDTSRVPPQYAVSENTKNLQSF